MRWIRNGFGRLVCCFAACAGGMRAGHPAFGGLDAETQAVLGIFEEISRVPRCSGHEAAIGGWLTEWGKAHGFRVDGDRGGNVFIRVPATPGREAAPGIILQAHMDMVCQKDPASPHDFSKDPITLLRDGDWLKADRTTLGADDGIGMAVALSIALDPGIAHPPLELMFTTGEETTGLGVDSLERANIDGKVLINLDSEEEGMLIIGDASSTRSTITALLESEALPPGLQVFTLRVDGLRGGHSGLDILKPRANAIKVAARALDALQKAAGARLVAIQGGTARNAIPRTAEARIALAPGAGDKALGILRDLEVAVRKECGSEDPDLRLSLVPDGGARPGTAFRGDETARLAALLLALPNGAAGMDARFPGIPETSNSLGIIESDSTGVVVQSMQRGSVASRLDELGRKIAAAAASAGASANTSAARSPWLTAPDADVVRRCTAAYARVFGHAPAVSVIHGGLECAGISRKGGGLDTVSIGPTLQNPHSPAERVFIPSVKKVRDLLVAVLEDYR